MRKTFTIANIVWKETLRTKEAYVLLILLGALLLAVISLNVFGLGGTAGYAADIGFVFAWLFSWILAVSVGSRQLPREESRGTVYSLLAKPVTRAEVVIGKWMGAWSVACAATLTFYVLVTAVVFMKGGTPGAATVLQGYLLHCVALALVTAIGIAFSTGMHSDAAASITYVFTGATFLVVPRIPALMAHETGWHAVALMIMYNMLPHFEMFDMRKRIVHDYGTAGWTSFAWSVCYGFLFAALFLLIAWRAYKGRRFSRGNR